MEVGEPYRNSVTDEAKEVLKEQCFWCVFTGASPETSKELILEDTDMLFERVASRGDRFCVLFVSVLVSEGLKAMTYSSTPKKLSSMMELFEGFSRQWDQDSGLREAKVLVERL